MESVSQYNTVFLFAYKALNNINLALLDISRAR